MLSYFVSKMQTKKKKEQQYTTNKQQVISPQGPFGSCSGAFDHTT